MTVAVPTNKSKNIESIYPLSPMQEGMLFHTLYEPESRVYFTQMKYFLHGNLDIFAFEQAWQKVLDRHPILRTIFVWENAKKTLQLVLKKVNLPWTNLDWRSLSPIEQEEQLEVLLQEDRNKDFVLDKAPLMRCTLIQLGEARYRFVWSSHHLLTDGWCMPIIFKEVFAFYDASIEGQDLYLPLPRPYKDYITWLQQQDVTKAAAYWQKALQGFAAPTPLMVDCTAKQQSEIKKTFGEQRLQLSSTATTALKSLAQKHRLTVSTLVQGAWGLLLSRYTGESDVVFGATVSGRPPSLSGVESMIGLFINTLPVRVKVSEETELVPWLAELQQQQVERDEYAYSSLVEIQHSSEVPKGSSLFDSLLVFENYPSGDSLLESDSSIRIDDFQGSERTNYPLTILVIPNEELLVRFVYDRDRFDADTITRMAGHFQTLLLGMVDNPQQKLTKLPLLTDFEKNQLLVEWNDTQVDYPEKSIYQLFEEQVAKTPDAVAVVFGSEKLTYQELNSRANKVAHHLQSLGVGPEVLVGICHERSLYMVIGLLAILKAGGAYVPLDPAYPQERLAYMLSNANVSVLLTQQQLVEQLPNCEQVVCLDTDSEIISAQIQDNLLVGVKPENLAYVIYTSGSTGKPKGVAMSNRSLVNLLLWQMENSQVSIQGKTLQFAPISFDVSFQEIFSTWCSGGTLVLISEDVRRDAIALLRLLTETGVERIFLPFVALQQLAEVATSSELFPTSLCEIITAGEQLQMTTSLTNFLTRLPDCRLENQYGPSESHVVTAFTLKGSGSALPPIGRPIANTQIYILDLQGQPVPIGVPGELHIAGLGLAREYLNRPELTAQKFILNPFDKSNSTYLYKTGDKARYLPDGNIEFLGRIDNQVKIRGFRIELGEIETTLTSQPQVKEAVVIVREDIPGKKRLVAYIVQTYITSPSEIQNQLRDILKHQLPEYMVPSAFMLLDALPLTPSGKVDRRALPAPDVINDTETFVAASTPTEEAIATIWGDVLGLKQVGIHDNFFELGGHSLLATQVISRLRQTWKMELPLRRLFEKPTVAELAQTIDKILLTVQKLQSNTSNDLLNNREEIEL